MAWFAFDIDLYDADTMHLTAAQDGVYSRLLRFYYKMRTPLPDDDRALIGIARISSEEWAAMASTIRAFFVPQRGKLRHKRCDAELDKQDGLAKQRTERSRRAANIRHGNELDATGMPDACAGSASAMPKDATTTMTIQKETDATASVKKAAIAADARSADGKSRGSRLPPDWQPSTEDREFAQSLGLSPDDATAEFRDYWCAVPGAKGLKLDWSRTFRNRCRDVAGRRRSGSNRQGNSGFTAAVARVFTEGKAA